MKLESDTSLPDRAAPNINGFGKEKSTSIDANKDREFQPLLQPD
jgi:hypothetical protein